MSHTRRTFSPIVELEHSAYTPYLPTTKKTAAYWVLGIIITIFACRIAFADRYEPEPIYLLGANLLWISFIMSTNIRALQTTYQPFQAWWLTFPLDRRTLIRAKLLASLRLNGYIAAAMWLVATVHNVSAATLTESPFHASASRLWADAGAYALLYVAIVLFITSIAALVPLMMNGWYRLLFLPYIVLWSFPMGNFGRLLEGELLSAYWQQASMVLLYACVAALLGWIVYHAAIHGVAKHGMRGFTPREPGKVGLNLHRQPSLVKRAVRSRSTATGFNSLFQLERSKHRSIAANQWLRLVRGIVTVGLMVVGYFTLSDSNWLNVIRGTLIIPSVIVITFMTLSYTNDMGKRRLEWLLSFPYSRFKIALSRLLALWTTTFLWVGGSLLAAAIGAGIRYVLDRPDTIGTSSNIYDAVYLLLLFSTYIVFGTLVSHVQYSTAKYPVLSIIGLPFMMTSYIAPVLFTQYMLPESLSTVGISHSLWIGLGLFAAIGLPFAVIIFIFATRGMAFSLMESQVKIAQRSGAAK